MSNVIGDANDEINFLHKLLLTNTQVSKICKAFASGSTANIKFSKTYLSKMLQFLLLKFLKFLVNPNKVIVDGIKKPQDLAKQVSDDGFITIAKVASLLKKYQ